MNYIFAKFLQRAESWADANRLDQGHPGKHYHLCSQPETAHSIRFTPNDRIVVVGDVSDRLWNIIEVLRTKTVDAPPIERVWLQ